MTKQGLTHFAIAIATFVLLGASSSPAQSRLVGPSAGSRAANSHTGQPRVHPLSTRAPGSPTVINFGTIDFPGASDSAAYGINDHGQFAGGHGPDLEQTFSNTGFFLSHDAFQNISFPGAIQTAAASVNNSSEIAGFYDDSVTEHGFQLLKGVYTTIDFPGADLTQVQGVNDSGEITGLYYKSGDVVGHGFYVIGSTYTTIDYPGAAYTFPCGLNNAGQIVGEWVDTAGDYHGFLWQSGTFTTIDYPGAVFSALFGINQQGDVVGEYGDGVSGNLAGFQHGFAYIKGQYLSIDVPFVGAEETWITGINKTGEISGIYVDTADRFYGFTAKIVP